MDDAQMLIIGRAARPALALLGVAAFTVACGSGAGGRERDWTDEEQSCGGTGEELPGDAFCRWPHAPCELPAPDAQTAPGADEGARPGALRLGPTEMARLTPALLDHVAAADGVASALALAFSVDRTLRPLPGCHLPVMLMAVDPAAEQPEPALVARTVLVATPTPFGAGPCAGATHFLAASWSVHGVALPLACPSLEAAGTPTSCVGAGLSREERDAWARRLYSEGHAAFVAAEYPLALDRFLTLRALMPDSAPALHNLTQALDPQVNRSCTYDADLRSAWEALPASAEPSRPNTSCSPAPPLLGCLPGFESASAPDRC